MKLFFYKTKKEITKFSGSIFEHFFWDEEIMDQYKRTNEFA